MCFAEWSAGSAAQRVELSCLLQASLMPSSMPRHLGFRVKKWNAEQLAAWPLPAAAGDAAHRPRCQGAHLQPGALWAVALDPDAHCHPLACAHAPPAPLAALPHASFGNRQAVQQYVPTKRCPCFACCPCLLHAVATHSPMHAHMPHHCCTHNYMLRLCLLGRSTRVPSTH